MKKITHQLYMKSSWWKKVSKSLLDDPEVTCAICGRKRWGIWKKGSVKKKKKAGDKKRLLMMQCHHIKYDNMGTEKEKDDILVLCTQCHDVSHIMQKKAKTSSSWKIIYKLLCKITPWEYEENVSKEYLVPDDFVEPKERKKKSK